MTSPSFSKESSEKRKTPHSSALRIRQADKANSKQSSNNSQECGVRKANIKIYCDAINKTAWHQHINRRLLGPGEHKHRNKLLMKRDVHCLPDISDQEWTLVSAVSVTRQPQNRSVLQIT